MYIPLANYDSIILYCCNFMIEMIEIRGKLRIIIFNIILSSRYQIIILNFNYY